MSAIRDILKNVPLPKMLKVRQDFDDSKVVDVPKELHKGLSRPDISDTVKPGMRIAITCGSRGIDNYALIIKELVDFCKSKAAHPFIVPAMGSHGGAKATGQLQICKSLGVSEEYCGCPIHSSMEIIEVGRSDEGHPVFIDKFAAKADGIIVVNRIKGHTGFSGSYESGLMKMLAIGLGKQYGASVTHQAGYGHMPLLIHLFGKCIIQNTNIMFAVGLIDNAYDKTCRIAVMKGGEIEREEPKLLEESRAHMARLLPEYADALIVDWMGKNISGAGMDGNITGRSSSPFFKKTNFKAGKLAVLNLTNESFGNMHGVGNADVISKRIFDKASLEATYPNSITSTTLKADAIPVMMPNDKLAIQCAIKTSNCEDENNPQVIRIKNTLQIAEIWVSEAMVARVSGIKGMTVIGEPEDWGFDAEGNLLDLER